VIDLPVELQQLVSNSMLCPGSKNLSLSFVQPDGKRDKNYWKGADGVGHWWNRHSQTSLKREAFAKKISM